MIFQNTFIGMRGILSCYQTLENDSQGKITLIFRMLVLLYKKSNDTRGVVIK